MQTISLGRGNGGDVKVIKPLVSRSVRVHGRFYSALLFLSIYLTMDGIPPPDDSF